MDYQFHDAANIFPLMTEDDFDGLVEDVRKNGLLEPIELLDGKILDGRNRHRACIAADVQPTFCEYHGNDPVGHVLSKNLHRRHLNESQRSMIGAKAKDQYQREAKERQKAAGGDKKALVENLPQALDNKGKARDKAAAAVGVSGRSVDFATKVIKQGTPELVKAVDAGRVPVSVAAKVATLPEPDQRAAVAGGKPAIQAAIATLPKPKPKILPVSTKAWNALRECSERIDSIIEQAGGSLSAMFAHPSWDKRDTYFVVELIGELSKQFHALNQEAQKHGKAKAQKA